MTILRSDQEPDVGAVVRIDGGAEWKRERDGDYGWVSWPGRDHGAGWDFVSYHRPVLVSPTTDQEA